MAYYANKHKLNESSVRSGDSLFAPSTEDVLKDERLTAISNSRGLLKQQMQIYSKFFSKKKKNVKAKATPVDGSSVHETKSKDNVIV